MDRRTFVMKSGAGLLAMSASARALAADRMLPGIRERSAYPGGDLAIVNARIRTMELGQPRAEAALVRDGRIMLIGTNSQILDQAAGVRRFDAGGRTVLPGFIDTHTHMERACWTAANLNIPIHIPEYKSLAQIFSRLRAEAQKLAPGRWIIARSSYNFYRGMAEQRYPTRLELDAISDRHPIAVFAGAHLTIMNTLALKGTKLWDAEEAKTLRWRDGTLVTGSDVSRDEEGIPTGRTTESWYLLAPNIYTPDEKAAAIRSQAVPLFTAKGITSLVNMPSEINDLSIDHQLQTDGHLPIRLRTFYLVPQVFEFESLVQSGLLPGIGDDMWRFGGVKLFVGGAGFDADLKPITDLKWTQEELNDIVWKGHAAGYQLLLHQAGESLPLTLNAIENAQQRLPRALRHRLEHYGRLQTPEEIERVKRLGIRVTITAPQSFRGQSGSTSTFPRYQTLMRAGLQPVSITDSTGTIPDFTVMRGIANLVVPRSEGGTAPDGERPTFDEAVAMWTTWAAGAQFEEHDKGSIAIGKLGDFAVLNADVDTKSGGALFDLDVDATILGGKVVHEK